MDTSRLSFPSVSPNVLASCVGTPDAPLVLDVRRTPRFDASTSMVAGAVRCLPEDIAAWAAANTPRAVVVYCVYGHNVSEEAVTTLRRAGWDASLLAGGFEGGEEGVDAPEHIAAWRSTRPPTMRKRPDLGIPGVAPTVWVTRERPKIDRIACPWLVRRFIDAQARFRYLPTSRVLDEAHATGAIAFDIPGAPITHVGEACSFDSLLQAFEIDDGALALLARIVRGADTDRLDLAPESAGLLAFSLGLSARHATDDHAMLEAAMPLYDALYAWCRAQCQGLTETHTWNIPAAATGTGSAA